MSIYKSCLYVSVAINSIRKEYAVLSWNEIDSYPILINVLKNDGVVLASSDTVLGLFAQLSEKAKNDLDSIKVRNLKPYIVMIKSASLLDKFIDQPLTKVIQEIIYTYWPGPLTIIFKAKTTLPNWMVGVDGTIALRVPHHEGLQKLLDEVDALFTTSANISEQSLPITFQQVNPIIIDRVQEICCEPDKVYDGPASTIIDVSSGSIKIIRQGVVVLNSI